MVSIRILTFPTAYPLFRAGILLEAHFISESGCVITKTNNEMLAASFIYTMCFDRKLYQLVILGLHLNPNQSSSLSSQRGRYRVT